MGLRRRSIAVIGATGQVGVELCITLKLFDDVDVVAIARSDLAAEFLRRCGVACRVGSVDRRESAAELLKGCDVVMDLSLPRGLPSQIRAASRQIITSAVAGSPEGARYVFGSTYMALGMSRTGTPFKRHWFSRTLYGANKRYAERVALRAGRKWGKDVFVMRLGQVHGEMQRLSHRVIDAMRDVRAYVPAGPSNTVFVYTIAEALVHIARGQERPGRYVMTSTPQWSWEDIHRYFARRRGLDPEVVQVPYVKPSPRTRLASAVLRKVADQRDVITAYAISRFPALELKAKAMNARRNAAAEIAAGLASQRYEPYADAFVGEAPGRRFRTLSDSRLTMEPYAERVRALLDSRLEPTRARDSAAGAAGAAGVGAVR